MIPVGLELGGKDPLYITDSITDIKKVASSAFEGAFYNNGQSCCAVERIYVHENVYPQFIEAISSEEDNLTPRKSMEAQALMDLLHEKFIDHFLKCN